MKVWRITITILACCVWAVSFYINHRWSEISDRIVTNGPRRPNFETGEIYEILYRGGATRYVTETEAWIHQLNFGIVPLCIIAGLWIMLELYRAGWFNLFK